MSNVSRYVCGDHAPAFVTLGHERSTLPEHVTLSGIRTCDVCPEPRQVATSVFVIPAHEEALVLDEARKVDPPPFFIAPVELSELLAEHDAAAPRVTEFGPLTALAAQLYAAELQRPPVDAKDGGRLGQDLEIRQSVLAARKLLALTRGD